MKLNRMLIILFIMAAIILVSSRFYFSEVSFGTTNVFWDGLSQFSSDYHINNLYYLSYLEDMDQDTALLIIGPTINFTQSEAADIKSYIEHGGNVIVMDDYGTSNSLLNGIGSPITLYQQPVCQYNNIYEKNTHFPQIKDFTSAGSIYQVNSLTLNHPVSLNVSDDGTVLATTSRLGWIDINNNGLVWEGERFGVYSLMASWNYGKGSLIVVSNADVATNGMIKIGDNRAFLTALLKNKNVYIDMTHGHDLPPLAKLYEIIKGDLLVQLLCVILILMASYVFYRRRSIINLIRPPPDDEEVFMDKKESMISYMKAKLPINESELNEMDKKL